jgi:hypothetical protein
MPNVALAPAHTEVAAGCAVTAGRWLTVIATEAELVQPLLLVAVTV